MQNNPLIPSNPAVSIITHFESLSDPRQSGKVEHKLIDIIIITRQSKVLVKKLLSLLLCTRQNSYNRKIFFNFIVNIQ